MAGEGINLHNAACLAGSVAVGIMQKTDPPMTLWLSILSSGTCMDNKQLKDKSVCMLFLYYGSAFNAIVPVKLGINPRDRTTSKHVRMVTRPNVDSTPLWNTPGICAEPSPLLPVHVQHDCTTTHYSIITTPSESTWTT